MDMCNVHGNIWEERGPDYRFLRILEPEPGCFSEEERLRAINGPLIDWYREHARDLPWRKDRDAYHVWISEIMLQQTRVEAVKPYYLRFMEAFPNAEALAGAEDEVLLKMWEGLGYYSRARNLKKAAIRIRDEYGGELPASREELLTLPGIGSYTAGAVASIAFGIPVPAVDGNVLRVLSRFLGSRLDVSLSGTKKRFEKLLSETMDREEPGLYNQGLFEVGALVCVPNGAPRCGICPLAWLCRAKREGLWEELPVKASKKPRRVQEKTIFVLTSGTQVAIRKRPDKGLLASLYEFPGAEGCLSLENDWEKAADAAGVAREDIVSVEPLGEAKHIFSHVEWHMTGYHIRLKGKIPERFVAADIRELETRYPIPSAFEAYRKAFSER